MTEPSDVRNAASPVLQVPLAAPSPAAVPVSCPLSTSSPDAPDTPFFSPSSPASHGSTPLICYREIQGRDLVTRRRGCAQDQEIRVSGAAEFS